MIFNTAVCEFVFALLVKNDTFPVGGQTGASTTEKS